MLSLYFVPNNNLFVSSCYWIKTLLLNSLLLFYFFISSGIFLVFLNNIIFWFPAFNNIWDNSIILYHLSKINDDYHINQNKYTIWIHYYFYKIENSKYFWINKKLIFFNLLKRKSILFLFLDALLEKWVGLYIKILWYMTLVLGQNKE